MPCNNEELYVAACDPEDPIDERQLFDFIPVSGDEVLIQAYEDDSRCMERSGRNITLEECNSTITQQRFFAVRGGFNSDRFELSQKRVSEYCVNQGT